jgi:hypothetical protein
MRFSMQVQISMLNIGSLVLSLTLPLQLFLFLQKCKQHGNLFEISSYDTVILLIVFSPFIYIELTIGSISLNRLQAVHS